MKNKRINYQIVLFFLLIAGIGDTLTTFWGFSMPDVYVRTEFIVMPDGNVIETPIYRSSYESHMFFVPFISTFIFAFATLTINHLLIKWKSPPMLQNILVSFMLAVSFSPTISNLLIIWRW